MTFPAYITDGAVPPKNHTDYRRLRLVSVIGGERSTQIRTLKLAAMHRDSDDTPIAQMRVYSDTPDTWLLTGFTDIVSLSSLAHGIGELPDVTIVDHLDTASTDVLEVIEHVKASVRPAQFLAVSYNTDHPVAHNADLVHWLGLTSDRKTG